MGTAHEPQPVKLVASLLTGDLALLEEIKITLAAAFGPIDFASELLPFDHTDYYRTEFGAGLQRQIIAFEQLVDPARLPAIKLVTNDLERSSAAGGKRRVNIDPGYLALGKLVLASTKDHAHRVYLERGIYAEATLTFQRGRFRPWPWTYPDYASERYCALFDELRRRYKVQLSHQVSGGRRQRMILLHDELDL